MDAQPEYDMLMLSLAEFRSSVGFHLMDETPLPDALASPLWEAYHLVNGAIDKLASEYGCSESRVIIFAPPSLTGRDESNGSFPPIADVQRGQTQS